MADALRAERHQAKNGSEAPTAPLPVYNGYNLPPAPIEPGGSVPSLLPGSSRLKRLRPREMQLTVDWFEPRHFIQRRQVSIESGLCI